MTDSAIVELPQRVHDARVGRLATADRLGRPHVVPFCFAVMDDVIVTAVDQKPKTTTALRRLANVADNAAVSIIVDEYREDWSELWWVRIDGGAHVIDSGPRYEDALDVLAEKYPQYRADRPRGPVIVIEPAAVRSWP